MKQIIRDSSGYYLLGYNSTQAPTDGKFHEIKVRVSRRGVDVRARKGYWALSPEDAARVSAPPKPEAPAAVTAALNSLAEPERGRPARFWIGTSRGDNGQTRVTFSWEAIAPPPGSIERTAPAARIALTANANDGRQLFRGRVPEDGAASAAPSAGAVRAGGRRLGRTRPRSRRFGAVRRAARSGALKIVVEGTRGEVVDSVSRDLTLPDFTRVQVAFCDAAGLPRPHGSGADRHQGQSGRRPDGGPRLLEDRPPAHSHRSLHARRGGADPDRTAAQSRRRQDGRSARAGRFRVAPPTSSCRSRRWRRATI